MKILPSLICDRAQQAQDGRLFVEGQYCDLYAPGFPAKHNFTFVSIFEWSRNDFGRYNFTVELIGPNGNPTLRGEGHSEVVESDPSGPAARTYYIQALEDVVFPEAGEYRFRIQVKGEWHEGPVLYLWEAPEAGEAPA